MIPIENSIAGRVADIHHLLPHAKLHIVGEHFLPIHFNLMAPKGATLKTVKSVESHIHALGQCRRFIRKHGYKAVIAADTAGAARQISETRRRHARRARAEARGGDLRPRRAGRACRGRGPQHHALRGAFARGEARQRRATASIVTTFVFQVRNLPAALYKALGGFATNGVNMTKLESYMIEGNFFATMFYADVEGHPDDPPLARALEELEFFTQQGSLHILGVYPGNKTYRSSKGRGSMTAAPRPPTPRASRTCTPLYEALGGGRETDRPQNNLDYEDISYLWDDVSRVPRPKETTMAKKPRKVRRTLHLRFTLPSADPSQLLAW